MEREPGEKDLKDGTTEEAQASASFLSHTKINFHLSSHRRDGSAVLDKVQLSLDAMFSFISAYPPNADTGIKSFNVFRAHSTPRLTASSCSTCGPNPSFSAPLKAFPPYIDERASMTLKKLTSPPLEPMDFFPFRGQYGGSAAGAALFVAVRTAVPVLFYSLLAPPTSVLSIFSSFPSTHPSRSAPADDSSIPFFPDPLLRRIEQSLGLPSYSAMMFLGAVLSSGQFVMYNTIWRREKFPMTGQGGSIQVTT